MSLGWIIKGFNSFLRRAAIARLTYAEMRMSVLLHLPYGRERVRILLSSLIALIVCGSTDAFAQAKKIDCSKMKFSISLPFQECTVEPNAPNTIDAFVGRGHDASSSYNIGMYVLTGVGAPSGLPAPSQEQLLEGSSNFASATPPAYGYKGFFAQTPARSSRSAEGPWLRFDATVLRPDGSTIMNCLQFSKYANTSKWILFGSLCVKEGKAPTNAADLVLQSLQVDNQFEEDVKQKAEAAELALRLGQPDRQKIQLALTALGFDTLGTDGMFGPRSREMITAWQRARNYPTMGYLTSVQLQSLLREAALPIAKYEGDQRKIEEEKKKVDAARNKAEEEAKVRPAAPTAATSAPAPVAAAAPAVGAAAVTYKGSMYCRSAVAQLDFSRDIIAIVSNGQGAGQTQEKFYMRIDEQNAVAEWFGYTSSISGTGGVGCGVSFKGKVHETGVELRSTSATCRVNYRCELSMKRVP